MNKFLHTGKKGTMPFFMWKHDVYLMAKVPYLGDDDELMKFANTYLHTWYHAGEPVWMAAQSLKHVVTVAKRELRAEREAKYLRKLPRPRG